MSLPFQPLSLTFKEVWYSVAMPAGVGQDVIDRAKVGLPAAVFTFGQCSGEFCDLCANEEWCLSEPAYHTRK